MPKVVVVSDTRRDIWDSPIARLAVVARDMARHQTRGPKPALLSR